MNRLLNLLLAWLRAWVLRLRRTLDGRTGPDRVSKAVAPASLPRNVVPSVCVVIPALNEAARIAEVVGHAWADPATADVIVVDDSSIDDTARLAREAGARVITSTMLGKGASMADGMRAAEHEVLVYLDGDLTGLQPGLITQLARPVQDNEADFVKARFGRGGGRVTELTAKPMLRVFFPELADFGQPLGGIIAARRSLLQQLTFEDGYGVDVGLLIDACLRSARLAEVDIGRIEHDSQPLTDLTAMANEVSRVVYSRAREAGRLHVDQISAMYEMQRQATASWDYVMTRQRGRQRLLLLAMEDVVVDGALTASLAAARIGSAPSASGGVVRRDTQARAEALRFVHRTQLERAAKDLPLRPGVVDAVRAMRRAGFMVGVISDEFFIAADIVRRRVFADFAMAHLLLFQNDVCSGQMRFNEAFLPSQGVLEPDKRHVAARFCQALDPTFDTVWAVGSRRDTAWLAAVHRGFVFNDAPVSDNGSSTGSDDRPVVLAGYDDLRRALQTWLDGKTIDATAA